MTKSTAFLFCIACLFIGFYTGQHSLDIPDEKNTPVYATLLTDMTSQGRQSLLSLKEQLLKTHGTLISDIFFQQSLYLKEIASETPDKEFILKKSKEARLKQFDLQKKADKAVIDALLSMPRHDRETYWRHYLKNKDFLTQALIVHPLMTHIKKTKEKKTGQPRDAVARRTNVPDLSALSEVNSGLD